MRVNTAEALDKSTGKTRNSKAPYWVQAVFSAGCHFHSDWLNFVEPVKVKFADHYESMQMVSQLLDAGHWVCMFDSLQIEQTLIW
jgi:hypothetical protein